MNVSGPATAGAAAEPPQRLESVDLLRGLVMVLMALDHTRDFFHTGPFAGQDPLDLKTTSGALFFTRWITHFCAPIFIFLAGTGAFLSTTRGRKQRELSWFLFSRGLWLILLEVTWVQWAGWTFAINLHTHFLIVIWAIGCSMLVLAALVHLPIRVITGFGIGMIVLHNATDAVKAADWGQWAWLWRLLHAGGEIKVSGHTFAAGYPLIPWIGVMATGYSFGRLLQCEPAVRRRWLVGLGSALTIAFFLLRASNLYGDPKPWTAQATWTHTVMSFLDCHKYPPSLCYLLMTLGPALLALAAFDRGTPRWLRPVLVFGRVPLFYYLLHLPLLRGLAVLVYLIQYGRADWLYGLNPAPAPSGTGFGLAGVYLAWMVAVALLYPVCRWFAALKRRRRDAWLSYF